MCTRGYLFSPKSIENIQILEEHMIFDTAHVPILFVKEQPNKNIPLRVIKHGLLENPAFSSMIFPSPNIHIPILDSQTPIRHHQIPQNPIQLH